MNGQAHVRPEVRAKVLQAADELGYKPNWAAKSLRAQRSHAVAFIVPDIANPYYIEIYKGMLPAFHAGGYLVFLLEDDAAVLQDHWMRLKFDGLIFAGNMSDRPEALRDGLPVVRLDADGADAGAGKLERIITQNLEPSMVEAIDLLASLGHRRFGMIVRGDSESNPRIGICRSALKRHGLELEPEHIATFGGNQYHHMHGAIGMETLLARGRGITALIASNDTIALGAIAAAAKHGLRVPEQLSVLGCDDTVAAAYALPPLSTIKLFKEKQGALAARLLMEMMEGRDFEARGHSAYEPVRLDTRFIRRESIGPV